MKRGTIQLSRVRGKRVDLVHAENSTNARVEAAFGLWRRRGILLANCVAGGLFVVAGLRARTRKAGAAVRG